MRNNIRTGKTGFLDVKLGQKNHSRITWKGWRKKWVVVQGMFNLVTGKMAVKLTFCPDDHAPSRPLREVNFEEIELSHNDKISTERCSCLLLEDVSKIKRTKSKSKQYAFSFLDNEDTTIINLAGHNESTSQKWMSHLHSIFWPHKSSLELERVFSDLKEISIIDTTRKDRSLCGCIGFLSVNINEIAFLNPSTGEVIEEWPLRQIRRFTTIAQNEPEDEGNIFRMEVISKREKYAVDIYSDEAEEILNNIELTIKTLMNKKIKKPVSVDEISSLDVTSWESHYDIPKKKCNCSDKHDGNCPLRTRNISIRLSNDIMHSVYDIPNKIDMKNHEKQTKVPTNEIEPREMLSSLSSEDSAKYSTSTCSDTLESNNINDTLFEDLNFLSTSCDAKFSSTSLQDNVPEPRNDSTNETSNYAKIKQKSTLNHFVNDDLDKTNDINTSSDSNIVILINSSESVDEVDGLRKFIPEVGNNEIIDNSTNNKTNCENIQETKTSNSELPAQKHNPNRRQSYGYGVENIYEDLDKYRKHKKDLNKYLGIPILPVEEVASPPLPPREYKNHTNSLPSPQEYWFSNERNLDLESSTEDHRDVDKNRFSFHSYIASNLKDGSDSTSLPSLMSSPIMPRSPKLSKTPRIKKKSTSSLMRIFNSDKTSTPSATNSPSLSSSSSCTSFDGYSNSLSSSFSGSFPSEDNPIEFARMRNTRAGSDPCKMKMKSRTLSPSIKRKTCSSMLLYPVSPVHPVSPKLNIKEKLNDSTLSVLKESDVKQQSCGEVRRKSGNERPNLTTVLKSGTYSDISYQKKSEMKRPTVHKHASLPAMKLQAPYRGQEKVKEKVNNINVNNEVKDKNNCPEETHDQANDEEIYMSMGAGNKVSENQIVTDSNFHNLKHQTKHATYEKVEAKVTHFANKQCSIQEVKSENTYMAMRPAGEVPSCSPDSNTLPDETNEIQQTETSAPEKLKTIHNIGAHITMPSETLNVNDEIYWIKHSPMSQENLESIVQIASRELRESANSVSDDIYMQMNGFQSI